MKIKQAKTAVEHFYNQETQTMLETYEAIVREIFTEETQPDWTLKEIGVEFRERTELNVPDSSLCRSLHSLRHKGVIIKLALKRPCRVNSIMKQTWALVKDDTEEEVHTVNSASDTQSDNAFTP